MHSRVDLSSGWRVDGGAGFVARWLPGVDRRSCGDRWRAASPRGTGNMKTEAVEEFVAQQEFLPFARPSITDRERAAVLEVLDSGWLTTGPKTKAFEAAFAERVGVRHAIALNSATAALHLALYAFGVDEGDEVIVPTWTFAASAEVVAYRRGKVVLVDVEHETLNATTDGILAAVTPKTKAVIAVHIAGRPMAIEELVGELDARGIPVVEDSAHAFPSR